MVENIKIRQILHNLFMVKKMHLQCVQTYQSRCYEFKKRTNCPFGEWRMATAVRNFFKNPIFIYLSSQTQAKFQNFLDWNFNKLESQQGMLCIVSSYSDLTVKDKEKCI